MRVLGIESSSTVASIAILDNDKLLCEYTINDTIQHSKTLMPMLEEVTKRVNIDIASIELIAVSEGPGSFTGLRIGSATAKGIAHGLQIPIASIPSLEVLASGIHIPNVVVGVVLHARAREVYYATYHIEYVNQQFRTVAVEPIVSMEIESLIELLKKEKPDVLVGNGIEKFSDDLEFIDTSILKMSLNYCSFSAKTVALLGVQRYHSGDVISYYEQKPYYHKKAQAEREYEEKHQHD